MGWLDEPAKEVECKVDTLETTVPKVIEVVKDHSAEKVNGIHWKELLYQRLKMNEGFSPTAYLDTDGKYRIGFGTPINGGDPKKIRITVETADKMLRAQVEGLEPEVRKLFKNFDVIDASAKLAVFDMAYNMGVTKLAKFVKMRANLDAGKYLLAAKEVVASNYYHQVKSRALDNARLIANAREVVSEEELRELLGV